MELPRKAVWPTPFLDSGRAHGAEGVCGLRGHRLCGRRHSLEAQREAFRLRDRHDSLINEADGRDQPVDLKPQAREVQ
jgi:hypothetical protein